MNITLLFVFLLSFVLAILVEHSRRSVFSVFFLGLTYNTAIPVSIDLWSARPGHEWYIFDAALFAVGFNLFFAATRAIWFRLTSKPAVFGHRELDSIRSNIAMRRSLIASLMCLLGCFLFWKGMELRSGSIFSATWTDGLEMDFEFSSTATFLFFSTVAIGTLLLLQRRYLLLLIVCFAQLFTILLIGARSMLPGIVFPLLYLAYQTRSKYWALYLLIAGGAFPFAMLFLQMFRWMTGSGGLADFDLELLSTLFSDNLQNPLETSEISLHRVFYDIFSLADSAPGFLEGITYIRLLLLPIPSFLIPDLKPPDFASVLCHAYYSQEAFIGCSLHPTFFGDAYGNLGWFGIFTGVFWASFFGMLEAVSKKISWDLYLMALGPAVTFCLLLARGSIYIGTFQLWYMGILGIILSAFSIRSFRPNTPQSLQIRHLQG